MSQMEITSDVTKEQICLICISERLIYQTARVIWDFSSSTAGNETLWTSRRTAGARDRLQQEAANRELNILSSGDFYLFFLLWRANKLPSHLLSCTADISVVQEMEEMNTLFARGGRAPKHTLATVCIFHARMRYASVAACIQACN